MKLYIKEQVWYNMSELAKRPFIRDGIEIIHQDIPTEVTEQ